MKLLVFTYAPAGLGHLRVTDALVDSRPKNFQYLMLGSYDRFITNFHRFFSVNPIAKWIFTNSQYGLMEDVVTHIYRGILVLTSGATYKQMRQIINDYQNAKEIWVVATHFGMAHQLGAVKERLINETGKVIRLIVQVTDDTSQHIWCIRGADLTFVPSLFTKNKLEKYSNNHKMNLKFEVIPYPLCPVLTNRLDKISRHSALVSKNQQINVAVPISGAAVGLAYVSKLILSVSKKSDRFKFWVLVKSSMHTDMFLKSLAKMPNVNLITGRNDNEMISLYELLYQENLIHLEITKPSEQSFKAILPPSLVGGSIMLFTSPVGRQEYENIEFLVRQGLMPKSNYDEVNVNKESISSYPRAIKLSNDPEIAADFIFWALDSGLFARMSGPKFNFSSQAESMSEVGPNGAKNFWEVVERHFS